MENKKKELTTSFTLLICTIANIILYVFKWGTFDVAVAKMQLSLWEIASNSNRWGDFLDEGLYAFLSICIYIGAILAIVFLVLDGYRILKMIFESKISAYGLSKVGIGYTASLTFCILFILTIIIVGKMSYYNRLGITIWPVTSCVISIANMYLLKRIPLDAHRQIFEPIHDPEPKLRVEQLPVTNYSPTNPYQPIKVLLFRDPTRIAVEFIDYDGADSDRLLKGLRADIEIMSLFKDTNSYKIENVTFNGYKHCKGRIKMTEEVEIYLPSSLMREARSAHVLFRQAITDKGMEALCQDYENCEISFAQIEDFRKLHGADAMRQKIATEKNWICICGSKNQKGSASCWRCRRENNDNKKN